MQRLPKGLLASTVLIATLTAPSLTAADFIPAGDFAVLSYNVAGLPAILSSGDPAENTASISPLLNAFDIVNVQEDFNYHNDLVGDLQHPYLTGHSGGAGFGDGMNTFSFFPMEDVKRVVWDERFGLFDNGSDQLTPKGFSFKRLTLDGGAAGGPVFVDVYNLHADAGSDDGSLAARRSNLRQLADYIAVHSAGQAVIVMGDTNSRYTRAADIVEEFLAEIGGSDPWIELVRGGTVPEDGTALTDESDRNAPGFEIVDKIFYRSGPALRLTALSYRVEDQLFLDDQGERLSDHYAVSTDFSYDVAEDIAFSEFFGGSGGSGFSDLARYPEGEGLAAVSLRSGERLDALGVTYSGGLSLNHGGGGGDPQQLRLNSGEYLVSAYVCRGARNGGQRIFYLRLSTNHGRTLAGGEETGDCQLQEAPSGWRIIGFQGRDGNEIDKLGAIYGRF